MTAATTLDERWHRNFEAHRQRLALKERAIAYLGGRCQKCGYDKCPSAFDFHHLDPSEKDFDISSKTSWATIEPELKKCSLLCANCHRETHDGWHPDLLTHEEEGMGYGEDLDPLGWDDDEDTKIEQDPPSQVGNVAPHSHVGELCATGRS